MDNKERKARRKAPGIYKARDARKRHTINEAKGIKQPAPGVLMRKYRGSSPKERLLAGICCWNCKSRGVLLNKSQQMFVCNRTGAEVWFRARCNMFELCDGKRLEDIEFYITTKNLNQNPYWKKYHYGSSSRGKNNVITYGRCCRNCYHALQRKFKVTCTQREGEFWHLAMCKHFKMEDRPGKLVSSKKPMARSGADVSHPSKWATEKVSKELVLDTIENNTSPAELDALVYYWHRGLQDKVSYLAGAQACAGAEWHRWKREHRAGKSHRVIKRGSEGTEYSFERGVLWDMQLEALLTENEWWNGSNFEQRAERWWKCIRALVRHRARQAEYQRRLEAYRRKIACMRLCELRQVAEDLTKMKFDWFHREVRHNDIMLGKELAKAGDQRGWELLAKTLFEPTEQTPFKPKDIASLRLSVQDRIDQIRHKAAELYPKGWGSEFTEAGKQEVLDAHVDVADIMEWACDKPPQEELDFMGRIGAYNSAFELEDCHLATVENLKRMIDSRRVFWKAGGGPFAFTRFNQTEEDVKRAQWIADHNKSSG